MSWDERAACRPLGPALFYAEDTTRAKQVCAACPVRGDCREWAMTHPDEQGVWGGLDEKERAGRRRWSQPCGTHAAFRRHKRNGEKPCDRCEAAEREYDRKRTGSAPVVLQPHGTPAALRRHYRRGEPPCSECWEAKQA